MTTKPVKNETNIFQPQEDSISGRRVDTKKRGKAKFILVPAQEGTVEQLALRYLPPKQLLLIVLKCEFDDTLNG